MGDVVHCLPVLTALRRALPRARIGWVVERAFAPLLEGHPDLDELIVVRLREWRRSLASPRTLREIAGARRALREFEADAAIDLMGNHKGGILGAVTLADRRVGLSRPFRREPSSAIWNNHGVEPLGKHAVDRGLGVLSGLELERQPDTAGFGGDRLFPLAPAAVDGRTLATEPPFVAILPGAGWANKRYPSRWWGRVAERLGELARVASWVVSGPGEEALAREAALASRGWAQSIHAGSLAELAAVLRAARAVLGGDTGPLHLAHAMGVPVLCLMGPTDPRRSGPYGAPDSALWHHLPCSFCEKRYDEIKACLLAIPPARVAERAAALVRL